MGGDRFRDEPGSLLDSLNAWQEKVTAGSFWGIPGLSRCVELKLLNLLTFQLDRELLSHNVTVGDLQKRMNGVLRKGYELLEVMLS